MKENLNILKDMRKEMLEYSDFLDSLKDDEHYFKKLRINKGSEKYVKY